MKPLKPNKIEFNQCLERGFLFKHIVRIPAKWRYISGIHQRDDITIKYVGVPGMIRTCDPQFRKLMLYPAELRGHEV